MVNAHFCCPGTLVIVGGSVGNGNESGVGTASGNGFRMNPANSAGTDDTDIDHRISSLSVEHGAGLQLVYLQLSADLGFIITSRNFKFKNAYDTEAAVGTM